MTQNETDSTVQEVAVKLDRHLFRPLHGVVALDHKLSSSACSQGVNERADEADLLTNRLMRRGNGNTGRLTMHTGCAIPVRRGVALRTDWIREMKITAVCPAAVRSKWAIFGGKSKSHMSPISTPYLDAWCVCVNLATGATELHSFHALTIV